MARRNRDSLLDDEIVQQLHADRLSDVPSDCESDKSSNDDDDDDDGDDDFEPSESQKGRRMARLEVGDSHIQNDLDVNIDNDDDIDYG
jgi:hypothetical protein